MSKYILRFLPQGRVQAPAMLALLLSFLFFAQIAFAGKSIDIMVVYGSKAQTWVAGEGGMQTFAEDAVNRMNQAMENSDSPVRYRLVHTMSVSYAHSAGGLTNDLTVLQTGSGVFASVAAARDQYGADLVTMLVDTGSAYGYTGLAYMLGNWTGHPDYAHAVCAIRSVAISHTMTHEVGHNLGADHARGQAGPGPNDQLDNQYSAGHYFNGSDGVAYHTIMAYDTDDAGRRYTEAPLFSTPLVKYQGVPAGEENRADNVRLLRKTWEVIVGYRPTKVETPVDPDPIDPQRPYANQIYVMYAGYFGRPPGPGGFVYYTDWMAKAGGKYGVVIDDFYKSDESQRRYGGTTTRANVAQIYRSLFAREPAAAGLDYWVDMIGQGKITLPELPYTIAYNASEADNETLNAKISAAKPFMTTLERVQRERNCQLDLAAARDYLARVKNAVDAYVVYKELDTIMTTACR